MIAQKFRRKPGTVEAVRWTATDDSYDAVCRFVGELLPNNDEEGKLTLTTPHGARVVRDGDWVVKDADGVLSVEHPRAFLATYEPAE